MSSSRPGPAYLILEEPFVLPEPRSFLGRFVVKMHDPKQQYAPDNSVSLALDAFMTEPIVSTTVGVAINGLTSDRAKGRLRNALSVGAAREGKLQMNLESKLVTTYSLEQHPAVFALVVGLAGHVVDDKDDEYEGREAATARSQVRELLRLHGRAYMVVSLKTAVDPDVTLYREQATSLSGSGYVPVSAVTGGPPGAGDPQVRIDRERRAVAKASGQGRGEQIFAVKYCLVKMEKRLEIKKEPGGAKLSARLKASPALKGLQRHGKSSQQVLAMGGADASSSASSKDEENVEYSLEDLSWTPEENDLLIDV